MAEYDPNRRATAVPRLKSVGYSEATEDTDRKRSDVYVKAREALADEIRRQGKPKRTFSDLVKKKK